MSPDRMPPLVKQIMTGLRYRFASLNNTHYEAAWTDSRGEYRCRHKHHMLSDAARCGLLHPPGWFVLAVERGEPRPLTAAENKMVDDFRFASRKTKT